MKLPGHGRYDYVPIHKRPQYEWPECARLAVTFCNNIEYFAFGSGLGADPSGTPTPQNHRNYAWRDYGNRVGLWHYLDLLDEFGLPGAHNVNSAVLEACPDIVERLKGRGDEFVGHGRTNAEHQDSLWEDDEARLIADCTEVVTRLSGRRPEGWLGPGLAESRATPDLLKEAGYAYVMDWPADDQPFWLKTRAGPILSVPYPAELNDSAAIIHRDGTARDFADMIVDGFDEMVEQCRAQPLVMTLSLHPFVMGQPFRLPPLRKALKHCVEHPRRDRVWWTTPGAVADFCYALPAGIIPGGPKQAG